MPCDSRAVIRMRQDAYSYDSLADNSAVPEIIREWLIEQTGQTVTAESAASAHDRAYLTGDGPRIAFLVGEGVLASWVSITPNGIEMSNRLALGQYGHSRALDPATLEAYLNELSFLTAIYATSEVISDVADDAGYRTLTIKA